MIFLGRQLTIKVLMAAFLLRIIFDFGREKIMNRNRILYTITSLSPLLYIVLNLVQKQLQAAYSKTFEYPLFIFLLSIISPLVCSILLCFKMVLWTKMERIFCRAVDGGVAILTAAAVLLGYNQFGVLYFAANSPEVALVFCLQLCFAVYSCTEDA